MSGAERIPERPSGPFVHALALGLDPAWRRLPEAERVADGRSLAAALEAVAGVRTVTYSSIGLEPGVDLLLWRTADRLDALEEAAAAVLRSGLGRWTSVRDSLVGLVGPSQYVAKPTSQEQALFEGERARYLVVYPFTKSTDWYLLSREARQGVMNEHMRIGREFPEVRQLLAYSFGLDDQDFVVAYETDDLAAFAALVRALRGTESRRSTVRDTPILVGIRRPIGEILELLGAARERIAAEPGGMGIGNEADDRSPAVRDEADDRSRAVRDETGHGSPAIPDEVRDRRGVAGPIGTRGR